MKDNREKRKMLRKLGALRQNYNEEMFRHTKDKLRNYYTLIVQTTSSNGENQFGNIMVEDLQNKRYARIWDENVKDTEVRGKSLKVKGEIVESIMEIGSIWENTGLKRIEIDCKERATHGIGNTCETVKRSWHKRTTSITLKRHYGKKWKYHKCT
eukprot:6448236-Heterocapsa_arctica.AAC.1